MTADRRQRVRQIGVGLVGLVFVSCAGAGAALRQNAAAIDVTAPDAVRVTIGGQIRFRGEGQINYDLDDSAHNDENFILSRVRVRLDAHVSDQIQAIIEFQDARAFGEEGSTTAQLGRIDLKQGILRLTPHESWQIDIGRQRLSYGDQRLIGGLDWVNQARAFDGVRARWKSESAWVDLFATRLNEEGFQPGGTRGAETDADFLGVYASCTAVRDHTFEGYALFLRDERFVTGESGPGNVAQITVGGRYVARYGNLDTGAEAAVQGGDYGADEISAFAYHVRAGYTLGGPKKIRLGVEYNFATGDSDPADGDHETFNDLYPTNHMHYGHMDFVGWRNMSNVRLSVACKPKQNVSVQLDYHLLRLAESGDALYNAEGKAIRAGSAGADKEVGSEVDLTVKCKLSGKTKLLFGCGHLFAGQFLADTGGGDDAHYVYAQIQVDF